MALSLSPPVERHIGLIKGLTGIPQEPCYTARGTSGLHLWEYCGGQDNSPYGVF